MMNILIVVQARTGSTRLPGKILKTIIGKPVLIRQLERMRASILASDIIVAATSDPDDDIIEEICLREDFRVYRGHRTDLLERHYQAALPDVPDALVKIPSDCPLIDPGIIDKVLAFYIENHKRYDFVSNLHPPTYPDGNDVEVMSFAALEEARNNAVRDFEREHTTPYIWENPDKFRIGNVEWESGLDLSMSHRFTLDYEDDYLFIKKVYEELYSFNPLFTLDDIIRLLREKPSITEINKKYAGVNWYRHHLKDLKSVTPEQTKKI
ncbi:MAG: cytidylyltransferase domain-containing protein [Bacteroidota bacterium]